MTGYCFEGKSKMATMLALSGVDQNPVESNQRLQNWYLLLLC